MNWAYIAGGGGGVKGNCANIAERRGNRYITFNVVVALFAFHILGIRGKGNMKLLVIIDTICDQLRHGK